MDKIDRARMEELEARVLADSFLIRHLLAVASPTALAAMAAAADEYEPRSLGVQLPEGQLATIRRMIKLAVNGARDQQADGLQG